MITLGSVKLYPNNEGTKNMVNYIKRKNRANYEEEDDNVDCIENNIANFEEKDTDSHSEPLKTLVFGECFGHLNYDTQQHQSAGYYISDSACQLAVITKKVILFVVNQVD